MPSKNAARMGTKAKPSSVGAPAALLFEQGGQYKIELLPNGLKKQRKHAEAYDNPD
jgi:hypothetical protein